MAFRRFSSHWPRRHGKWWYCTTWQETVERMASGQGMVQYSDDEPPRIKLCSMGVTAPDLYAKCEEQKRVLDLRAGDVVFASRNLFQRTLQVTSAGKEHYIGKLGRSNLLHGRISHFADWLLLDGMEYPDESNPGIAGWTPDEVAEKKSYCWFPKVWPSRPDNLQGSLQALGSQIEAAKEKYKATQARLLADVAKAKDAANAC